MDERERKYLLSLLQIPKMNQTILTLLMERYGDAAAAWEKQGGWYKVLPLTAARIDELLTAKKAVDPARVAEHARTIKVKTVTVRDPEYPAAFRHISGAPYLLTYFGELPSDDRFGVTVIGARRCSEYGRDIAQKISGDLVRLKDAMIVSGMAEGIDTAAHQGALAAGGYTVAVLGTGIDQIYPAINTDLYVRLKREGCLISELPFGYEAHGFNFPHRNRLMSALGRALLVVEGSEKSGVFHTVNHALEQGKDVFAVPGSIFARNSYAPHYFIREGCARLVVSAADILSEYFDLIEVDDANERVAPDFADFPEDEALVLNTLKERDLSFDEITELLQRGAGEVSALLTRWDIEGLVQPRPGKTFSLCNYINEVKHE